VESHLRQREGVRGPLNRIADAAKMRREPVFGALSEQNEK
jgi:hypothetical protein